MQSSITALVVDIAIVHRLIAEIIDELNIQGKVIGVPPAGCAVLAYNYFDIDMGEAPHGRGAAVAYRHEAVIAGQDCFHLSR